MLVNGTHPEYTQIFNQEQGNAKSSRNDFATKNPQKKAPDNRWVKPTLLACSASISVLVALRYYFVRREEIDHHIIPVPSPFTVQTSPPKFPFLTEIQKPEAISSSRHVSNLTQLPNDIPPIKTNQTLSEGSNSFNKTLNFAPPLLNISFALAGVFIMLKYFKTKKTTDLKEITVGSDTKKIDDLDDIKTASPEKKELNTQIDPPKNEETPQPLSFNLPEQEQISKETKEEKVEVPRPTKRLPKKQKKIVKRKYVIKKIKKDSPPPKLTYMDEYLNNSDEKFDQTEEAKKNTEINQIMKFNEDENKDLKNKSKINENKEKKMVRFILPKNDTTIEILKENQISQDFTTSTRNELKNLYNTLLYNTNKKLKNRNIENNEEELKIYMESLSELESIKFSVDEFIKNVNDEKISVPYSVLTLDNMTAPQDELIKMGVPLTKCLSLEDHVGKKIKKILYGLELLDKHFK